MTPTHTTPVAILCGGRGTRLRGDGPSVPKALVEIGGRPILWHVMGIYLAHGFRRFLLLTGHRGEEIAAFAGTQPWPAGVEVACVPTGEDTPTGGRIHAVADRLAGGTACVTYADGVADLDLTALLAFHRGHGAAATVTVVRPELPFGFAELDGDRVTGFVEKPRSDRWINAGFLCLEPAALASIGPDDVLERRPMAAWAQQGMLRAHRHEGFWDCMDTYKDALMLNDLWDRGQAPWATTVAA